jgi:hypothetical protein
MKKINWLKCMTIALILFLLSFFAACNVLGYLNSRGLWP